VKEQIKTLAKKYAPHYIEVRRHLHQYPELSFHEFKTHDFIKKVLAEIGISEIETVAKTGVLATIKGKADGDIRLLRADIDALPIEELNDTSYISKNQGVMHACGHDAHTASLLLCARILFELKDDIKGSIKLLFQPGEEVYPGGATLVQKEGVYEELGELPHIGQHVMPSIPVGKVGFCSGKFMASMDEIFLTIKGKGGHGAMPETFIDPVLIASHIIVAAQQVVSRMASPKTPSVLSFGKLVANGAINIIPDEVYLEGTFRTLDVEWRKDALEKLEKLVKGIAESMGGSCKVVINRGYPHLVNDAELTSKLKENAASYLGSEQVVDLDPMMIAEDFAYYSHDNPSCFYLLGVGNVKKKITSGLHTPTFDIDESALEIGGGLMAYNAVSKLHC